MENENIFLWAVGGGFSIAYATLLIVWSETQRIREGVKKDIGIAKSEAKSDSINILAEIQKSREEAKADLKNLESSITQKFDKFEKNFDHKIEKLDEKLTDVDRRLCRIEGSMAAKECCMLKDDRQQRKAE